MGLQTLTIGSQLQQLQLSPSECENVVAHGAVGDGVTDDTAAFAQAAAVAGDGGSVCVPVGTYQIDADSAIQWGGRSWVGEFAHATDRSVIRARTAGTALINSTSRIQLAFLVVSGGSLANDAVRLNGADDSLIFDVGCFSGVVSGFHVLDAVRVTAVQVSGTSCPTGCLLERVRGDFYALAGDANTVRGIHVVGTGTDADMSLPNIFGALLELNTGAEQALIEGVRGGRLSGLYAEGVGDGIVIDGDTRNFHLGSCSFIGGGAPNVAVRLLDAKQCSFTGVAASGAPSSEYGRIRVEGASERNSFLSCHLRSGVTTLPMTVEFFDGVGSYECFPNSGDTFKGPAAPTRGNWKQGQMVFNSAPTGGSTLLWRCTVTGAPGTWEAVA